ncbi:MAG: glycogen-binding domain-containing protein [Candidatus Eisenbacteria bacterium]
MVQSGNKRGAARFSFRPDWPAKQVALAGDFSQWEPLVMRRQPDGSFIRTMDGLPCRCEYKFWVDGAWWHDPDHDRVVENAYGSLNSIAEIC